MNSYFRNVYRQYEDRNTIIGSGDFKAASCLLLEQEKPRRTELQLLQPDIGEHAHCCLVSDTRVTRLSKIDTRSPQGSHDLITFNRTSVSKMTTIGDHGIVLEKRDGLVQLFDLRQSNRARWSYDAKETCASIQEAGEAIFLQTKSGITVLNELSGKESFSFKMRKDHEFCGSLHGQDDEEMFLVTRTLNRSSMQIIGAREYAGGKGKPLLNYYGNSRSITHFVRFQRDLFATADESGRVVVQYEDTR
ncbi:hypothetical protein GCK72_010300 [Caenorhabditis remanei]|uniref:Vacuolar import/degradation Vid27 C-terminal domain-containing protein n=1 Tax=Caenorhabditis remanei TaxID=31234 RepID=A0A6A5H2W3_CAERE|nr:hypothetical protein GCK72_010300 [Caenorhabditis remanei]KAF1762038.1 hypothetical protein GCK72_010300 [Caenorhabditis remanei]